MLFYILFSLVGIIVFGVSFARLRDRTRALLQPVASLAQYRTSLTVGEEWRDCPICGCATIDTSSESPVCVVCDWDGGADASAGELREARASFERYGTVDSPAAVREWGGVLPDVDLRAAQRAVVDACRRAGEG